MRDITSGVKPESLQAVLRHEVLLHDLALGRRERAIVNQNLGDFPDEENDAEHCKCPPGPARRHTSAQLRGTRFRRRSSARGNTAPRTPRTSRQRSSEAAWYFYRQRAVSTEVIFDEIVSPACNVSAVFEARKILFWLYWKFRAMDRLERRKTGCSPRSREPDGNKPQLRRRTARAGAPSEPIRRSGRQIIW